MQLATVSYGVETNHADSTSMSIENNAHMFSILSDKLYSDKPRAVIREICCNALDACGRLKITMPTRMEPFLSIRDFGSGMSHEFMMGGYTKVGHSTKTTDNDQIGGFGIGRMAVFAYADAYTVTSITDMKRIYAVFRGDDGLPQVVLSDSGQTDEPRGVEVRVPIHARDVDTFKSVARDVLRWFPAGSVEGLDIEPVKPSVAGDGWLMLSTNRYAPTMLLMGPVAYRVDWNQVGGHQLPPSIMPVFKIGEIALAPNRESLSYDRKTIAALKAKAEEILYHLPRTMMAQAESMSATERLKLVDSLRSSNVHEVFSRFIRNREDRDAWGRFLPKHLEWLIIPASVTFYDRGNRSNLKRIPDRYDAGGFHLERSEQLRWTYVFRDDDKLARVFDRLEDNCRGPTVLVSPSLVVPNADALAALLPGVRVSKLSDFEPPYRASRPRTGAMRIYYAENGYTWNVFEGELPDDGIYVPFDGPDPDRECNHFLGALSGMRVFGFTKRVRDSLPMEAWTRLDDYVKAEAKRLAKDPATLAAHSAGHILEHLRSRPVFRFLERRNDGQLLPDAFRVIQTLKAEARASHANLVRLAQMELIKLPKVRDTHKALKLFERVSKKNRALELIVLASESRRMDFSDTTLFKDVIR